MQVNLAAVTPSDQRLLARISSLRPWTITWSNVADYLPPADFHRMARAASCPGGADTVHSMCVRPCITNCWIPFVKQLTV
jgi:hypothetical protein